MAEVAGLAIRALAEADLPAYKALRDHVLAHHEVAFTSDAATEALRTAQSYSARLGLDGGPGGGGGDGSYSLGAWRNDHLVGAITCERDPRSKVRHVGHIVGMMVLGDAQGQGVGRALLDALLARARADAELHLLTLSVTASNARATRLYERAGFTGYGMLPRAIRVAGRFFDKQLMQLTLR